MKTFLLSIAMLVTAVSAVTAGTSCTTRRSGSVVIETCTDSGHRSNFQQCRNYKSGSVWKKSCRS